MFQKDHGKSISLHENNKNTCCFSDLVGMLKRYSFFANGEKAEGLTWLSSPPTPLPPPPPPNTSPGEKS